jgi:prepilin-type N-terminal cleavage/methylation domain-containing protein
MTKMKSPKEALPLLNLKGLTLVELLIALAITGILLTAVVTLAYAMGSANEIASDSTQKQAQLRYTTLRIAELIKHSKLISSTSDGDLALWQADDNSNGRINPEELVYLVAGTDKNYIKLLEFSADSATVSLADIQAGTAKQQMIDLTEETFTAFVPQCSNVQIPSDITPESRFVSISFELFEDGIPCRYQINAFLRGWAGNLLGAGGEIVSDDD